MTRHLKRLAMPKTWPLPRKATVWITKPLPSGHPIEFSMPINIILRDLLHITKSTHETKKLLTYEKILIDNRIVKNYKSPLGLFDRLYLPGVNKFYTLIISRKNKLKLIELSSEEANYKPLKIKNKVVVKGGKIQLTFHDGRTIIADNKYKINDSVIFDLKNKKIIKHLPLTQNALVYIISGSHVGEIGRYVESIIKGRKKFAIVEFGKAKVEAAKVEVPIESIFVINEEIARQLSQLGTE